MSFLQPIEFITKRISVDYPRQFNHIGDHLKAARLDRGIIQKDAANLIGTDNFTLRNWESGKVGVPAIKHWPGIIKFLGYCPYEPCSTLPEKIAMWRKLNGVSSTDVAELLQIDPGTYSRFERGLGVSGKTEIQIRDRVGQLLS